MRVGEDVAACGTQRAAQGSHIRQIAAVRGEQGIPQGAFQPRHVALPVRLAKDAPSQRVAVGMQAVRRQANQHVPGAYPCSRDQVGPGGNAHHETSQVVIRLLVEPWQLGGLTTDQRHPVGQAGTGHAGHQVRRLASVQASDAEVVQEEERIGALHRDVVDAMVDEVLADGVVPAESDRDLELGAHAIGRGDQHGIGPALGVKPEEAAESADAAQHLRRRGLRRRLADQLHRAARLVEVDAGFAVRSRHGAA